MSRAGGIPVVHGGEDVNTSGTSPAIIRRRVPGASDRLAGQVAESVRQLRGLDLTKPPGIAEAVNWATALGVFGETELSTASAERTLSTVLKYSEDEEAVRRARPGRARRAQRLSSCPVTDQLPAGDGFPGDGAAAAMGGAAAPMRDAAGDPPVSDVAAVTARFGARLHDAGVPVDPGRCERFARAVTLMRPRTRGELYACGLATLVSGPDQIEIYDRLFAAAFGISLDQSVPVTAAVPADEPGRRAESPSPATPPNAPSYPNAALGAVVLIISDGWETGDAAQLGQQMARLSRVAYRIVWANPRTKSPRYRPEVSGMAAAWPYCDAVVSAHSLKMRSTTSSPRFASSA